MKILFLCMANSVRSQMAEGLARTVLNQDFEIESAGRLPGGKVSPDACETLREIGIDISSHISKHWEDLPQDFLENLNFAICLASESFCPPPSKKAKVLHWPLPDPTAFADPVLRRERFRALRDEIREKIQTFFIAHHDRFEH